MNIQEIEIFINPDGQVRYEVRGVKGKKCLDITKDLEADLGGEILSREETWEMMEQDLEQETDERITTVR